MKIKTKEQFFDLLDKESSWRKQELTTIYFSLKESRKGNENYFMRSAIALSYAHWEGFIKSSSEHYLTYLSFLGLKGNILSKDLKTSFLQTKAIACGEFSNYQNFNNFFKFYEAEFQEEQISFDNRKIIKTKSNLKYEIFHEIISKIGITDQNYSTKHAKVDALVDLRNSIAHGENARITLEEAIEYVSIVKELIQKFKTDLENLIMQESFLRQPVKVLGEHT